MKENAIVITGGILHDIHAKTTHALIRGSDRFNIVGVIDETHAGKDAGEVVDGKNYGIPVYATISDFKSNGSAEAKFCVIGVATKGGIIPDEMREVLQEAIEGGFSIVNGLHHFIADIPELAQLATQKEVELVEIRRPRSKDELKFWSGKIREVPTPKVAVLGTDCAVGKRTTAWILVKALAEQGIHAEMIYTGQTGWMLGARYGFIFDATTNDFISGELEDAIYKCYTEVDPDIIFMEGQSSLRNPSGPAGSEFLLSGEARGVILQHTPARTKFKGFESMDYYLPDLKDEIDLIRIFGADTIAVTLNTNGLDADEAEEWKQKLETELGIPVVLPMIEGVDRLIPVVHEFIKNQKP